MSRYRVTFARSARRELQALDPQLAERILQRIRTLQDQPRPPGCRKLRGGTDLWRLRVGQYRVLYTLSDEESWVDVVAVRHRSEAYR